MVMATLMNQGLSREEAELEVVRARRKELGAELQSPPSVKRSGEIELSESERNELKALGINPDTYKAGPENDNKVRFAGENARATWSPIMEEAEFQNFGGIDQNNRAKGGKAAEEEKQRARSRGNQPLTVETPNMRPDVDEFVDGKINRGEISEQNGEKLRYALKQQGVTDPVGEEMKRRDFALDLGDQAGNQRQQVRNERGYPGNFVWQAKGDLQIPNPPLAKDAGGKFYKPDDAGRMQPIAVDKPNPPYGPGYGVAARGQINSNGEVEQTPIVGLNQGLEVAYPGAGQNVTIKGGRGEFVETRKGGVKRFKDKRVADHPRNIQVSPDNRALRDAFNQVVEGLAAGTIPEDKREEAIAFVERVSVELDPVAQQRLQRDAVKDMVLADNADGAINSQIRARNLDKAVYNAEIGLVGEKQFDDVGYVTPQGLGAAKPPKIGYKEVSVAKEAPPSPLNAPQAFEKDGTYVDAYGNSLAIPEAELNNLDRFERMLGGQQLTPGQQWVIDSLIDENDYQSSGGYDQNFPRMSITDQLELLDRKFSAAGVEGAVKDSGSLEAAVQQVIDIRKSQGKAFNIRDPETNQNLRVEDPTIGQVLEDLKISGPERKDIARALFQLDMSLASGIDGMRKRAWFDSGESMGVSEAQIYTEDGGAFPGRASGKLEGKPVAALLRQINPEKRIREDISRRVKEEEVYLGRRLNTNERQNIEQLVKEENVIVNIDMEGNLVEEDLSVLDDEYKKPFIGIEKSGTAKGGRSEGRKVYQGMSDGQIREWFKKRNKPKSAADAAIAEAQSLRERQGKTEENQAVRRIMQNLDQQDDTWRNEDYVKQEQEFRAAVREKARQRGERRPSRGDYKEAPQIKNREPRFVPSVRNQMSRPQPIQEAPVAPSIAPDPWASTGPVQRTVSAPAAPVPAQRFNARRPSSQPQPQRRSVAYMDAPEGFDSQVGRRARRIKEFMNRADRSVQRRLGSGGRTAAEAAAALGGGVLIGDMIRGEREQREEEAYR